VTRPLNVCPKSVTCTRKTHIASWSTSNDLKLTKNIFFGKPRINSIIIIIVEYNLILYNTIIITIILFTKAVYLVIFVQIDLHNPYIFNKLWAQKLVGIIILCSFPLSSGGLIVQIKYCFIHIYILL